MSKALIYCRVSSERQKNEGHGLDSQEHRCRAYITQKGYEVEKVFRDSFSGGGDFMQRPAMAEMLAYIDSKPYNTYVVVFDDIKRLARDTEQHLRLREAFEQRKVTIECPNFSFSDSPEGKYVETLMAAGAQLEREQNRRQVLQKMKARVEMGYWCLPGLPIGYRHNKVPNGNSTPVLVEPTASIIKEALEGYASSRFPQQIDVMKFLQDRRLKGDEPIYLEQVKRILLQSLFYAGHIEYERWEISLRKGQHEPLIDLATHEKINEKLVGKVRTHIKKFLNPDFPLRKFVLCGSCLKPYTASWSTARNGEKRPYYRCNNKACPQGNKSIHRDDMHKEFEGILVNIKTSENVLNLTRVILQDIWSKKEEEIGKNRQQISRDLSGLEVERKTILTRISKATNELVIETYEGKLTEIAERERVLKTSLMSFDLHRPDIGTALDIVFDFLKNPIKQWREGDIHRKKLVLNLIFQENIAYNKNSGFGTATLSLSLRVFTLSKASETCLVEMVQESWNDLESYILGSYELIKNLTALGLSQQPAKQLVTG